MSAVSDFLHYELSPAEEGEDRLETRREYIPVGFSSASMPQRVSNRYSPSSASVPISSLLDA